MRKRKAFTLVELVIVIVVLGILAVIFAPKAVGLLAAAEEAKENSTIASIQEGLRLLKAYQFTQPV